MALDLTAIRALLASVHGFTPGPWRMSIENGGGIVAGARTAVVSAYSSPLGWPCALVLSDSRPLILAAPTLHAHLTELVGEVERLRAHNARMVTTLEAVADRCDAAATMGEDALYGGASWEDAISDVVDALPSGDSESWEATAAALRALAAGEVANGNRPSGFDLRVKEEAASMKDRYWHYGEAVDAGEVDDV